MEIKNDIMFVKLAFSLPKQSRKVKAEADIDPRRLKASAALYSGESFKAIKSLDSSIRNELLTKAIRVPSMFSGAYVLPAAMVDKVKTLLVKRQMDRDDLVTDFIDNDYQTEREAARIALNGSFRESDFPVPSELKKYFDMKWGIFTLEVPQGLPEDIREAETQKYRENMESVFTECRAVLRNTLSELVTHLADRLKPDADGTRKRLSKTTVDNLREFLDTVNQRDITSDEAIQDISAKARAILGTYSADQLKMTYYAEQVKKGLDSIKTEIDTLIIREGTRKIDLDME